MAGTAAEVLAAAGSGSGLQSGQESCDECGSLQIFPGFMGLGVCGDCGAMSSCKNRVSTVSAPQLGQKKTPAVVQPCWGFGEHLDVEGTFRVPPNQALRNHASSTLKQDQVTRERFARCRAAIALVGNSLNLQASLQDQAQAILVLFCRSRGKSIQTGMGLKLIVGACIFVASIRAGIGLTLTEVAFRAGNIDPNRLQKCLWRVCKVSGLRLHRTERNVDSLAERLCQHFNLFDQRGAVRDTTCALVKLVSDCWVLVGRQWGAEVAACFWLAARAFHYVINVRDIVNFIRLEEGGLVSRLRRVKNLLLSILHTLPWGGAAKMSDVHLYMQSVLEHWDVILPILPDLRRQAMEEDPEALNLHRNKQIHEDSVELMTAAAPAAAALPPSALEEGEGQLLLPESPPQATAARPVGRKRARNSSKRAEAAVEQLEFQHPAKTTSKDGIVEEAPKKKGKTRKDKSQLFAFSDEQLETVAETESELHS